MFDEEIRVINSKVVKTRKKHNCVFCNKIIEKGNKAKLDTVIFYNGNPVSCYSCFEKCKKEDLDLSTNKQTNNLF